MIYVIHIDMLNDTEKHFGELTDKEVCELCAKDEHRENHQVFYSIDELIAAFNSDEMFASDQAYIRMMPQDPMDKPFPITSVCRADLKARGFDVEEVDDSTMERLADKMGDDYCEQLFWTSMEIIASEGLGIPKTPIRVKDVEHLKDLIADDERHDFFIALNGGARSSKMIDYYEDKFTIENESDGTEQELTEEQLFDEELTNIGKAIKAGSLYAYNY